MSEAQPSERPEWLAGWQNREIGAPEPKHGKPGNPAWVKGMRSPNPAGRPVGSSPQTRLMQRMLEDADGIVDAIVAKALEGDASSAALIMSRVIPALKAQSQKVEFDFDASLPISRQVEQVLNAIASGAVPPDVGKQIVEAIGTLSAVRATEELEQRIIILEAKAI